ncbi:hypothetical protein SODALDRAFT_354504 [Sodiomyces alkalinus F11]|uniref:Secreted protein n=1 Tax=Sodiomyces alkalinus (strain CBS 110278 / VKM F-3762 / F11) TaxID=1314773 RepID=A0A3N2Q6P2_SODAK|nr:hypothetical protein SODALDRAFT_354504 [Sodiomyces alkalinus F11]ROT42367.1 hypothetical protein SODALDRAFT_354504 [Sodiomyces alkalinus F11]
MHTTITAASLVHTLSVSTMLLSDPRSSTTSTGQANACLTFNLNSKGLQRLSQWYFDNDCNSTSSVTIMVNILRKTQGVSEPGAIP